ncbi:MAG: hypothetical protein ABEJ73_06305 [Haloplanus sp.]
MPQPPPTPVPDQGTGWGLLFLLLDLYGTVALLGVGTGVTLVLRRFDRRVPTALRYLVVAAFLGAFGLAGFTVLVAATAERHDVVALLLAAVFVPPTLVGLRRRNTVPGRGALLAHVATTWCFPFLVGFGVLAGIGTQVSGVPPAVIGALATGIVVVGTVLVDRLFPDAPGD